MLSGNFCDLELQTNNIEWGSGVFSTVYCAIKRVVLFGTLKVLLKDVSTNYVADCWSLWRKETGESGEKTAEQGKDQQQTQPTYGTGLELDLDHIGGR